MYYKRNQHEQQQQQQQQSTINTPAESAVMSLVSLATDAMVVTPFLDYNEKKIHREIRLKLDQSMVVSEFSLLDCLLVNLFLKQHK